MKNEYSIHPEMASPLNTRPLHPRPLPVPVPASPPKILTSENQFHLKSPSALYRPNVVGTPTSPIPPHKRNCMSNLRTRRILIPILVASAILIILIIGLGIGLGLENRNLNGSNGFSNGNIGSRMVGYYQQVIVFLSTFSFLFLVNLHQIFKKKN